MTPAELLKEKRAARKKLCEDAGAILTKAHNEKRKLTAEEDTNWKKMHADADEIKAEADRLERQLALELELNAMPKDPRKGGQEDTDPSGGDPSRPGSDSGGGGGEGASTTSYEDLSPEQRAKIDRLERRALTAWGTGSLNEPDLSPQVKALAQKRLGRIDKDTRAKLPPEVRAFSDVTGSGGQYTVPQGFVFELETALKMYGGMLQAARTIPTEAGNLLPYPSINDTGNTAEQLADGSAAATNIGNPPTFGVINLSAYVYDSGIIQIPITLMQDSAFDLQAEMIPLLAIRIGRKLNNMYTVTGTGSSQPNAIINQAHLGHTWASQTAITYTELLTLEHSLDPSYRPKATWMFHDQTLLALKQLVDSNGRPLFIAGGVSQGIQGAAPDTIDGYRYWINQDMPQIGSGNSDMLFGDFSKYIRRRVRDIQTTKLVERYAEYLQVGFISWVREDGQLQDAGTHPVVYAAHPT